MNGVVIDAEFNGLREPTIVWCVVCRSIGTGEVRSFIRPDKTPEDLVNYVAQFDTHIGHNYLEYDGPNLRRLIPGYQIDNENIFDTLIASKYLDYAQPGGHSLERWGPKVGVNKKWSNVDHEFFQQYSDELLERCVSDVDITAKLYRYLSSQLRPEDEEPLRVEHKTALICALIKRNGFDFHFNHSIVLHEEISGRLNKLYGKFNEIFPKRTVPIRVVTPKLTKKGTLSLIDFKWLPENERDVSQFHEGASFCLFKWETFNPGSRKHVIDRLNDAGWKPTDRTKGHIDHLRNRSSHSHVKGSNNSSSCSVHAERDERFKKYGWKINETNLNTLPPHAPEGAKKLTEWLLLDSRRSTLEEWFKCYNHRTGKIHGNINHIGSWTHRKSHTSPNLANIPRSSNAFYGKSFRSLFGVGEGNLLVGTDATGIQLRVLAHYIGDPQFTNEVISGDIHSLNQQALGEVCRTRANAKTFIYAWLLGAGVAKVGEILGCSEFEAREAIDRFVRHYRGLEQLKTVIIPRDASRGYFIGFDGRRIRCTSQHLMMSGYLQAGESIIMKHACLEWHKKLREEGIPYWQVDDIHDEWQTRTIDDREIAEYIGKTQVEAIEHTGRKFNLLCPFTGEYNIGYNWYQTH